MQNNYLRQKSFPKAMHTVPTLKATRVAASKLFYAMEFSFDFHHSKPPLTINLQHSKASKNFKIQRSPASDKLPRKTNITAVPETVSKSYNNQGCDLSLTTQWNKSAWCVVLQVQKRFSETVQVWEEVHDYTSNCKENFRAPQSTMKLIQSLSPLLLDICYEFEDQGNRTLFSCNIEPV